MKNWGEREKHIFPYIMQIGKWEAICKVQLSSYLDLFWSKESSITDTNWCHFFHSYRWEVGDYFNLWYRLGRKMRETRYTFINTKASCNLKGWSTLQFVEIFQFSTLILSCLHQYTTPNISLPVEVRQLARGKRVIWMQWPTISTTSLDTWYLPCYLFQALVNSVLVFHVFKSPKQSNPILRCIRHGI